MIRRAVGSRRRRGAIDGVVALAAAMLAAAASTASPIKAVPPQAPAGTVQPRVVLSLRVWDRQGRPVPGTRALAMMGGALAAVDPVSLVDVSPTDRPVARKVSGDRVEVVLPAGRATALSVAWPTSPARGWSQVELDHGGRGWSASAAVNVTYQAAMDAQRRFDAAFAERAAGRTSTGLRWRPSAALAAARRRATAGATAMRAATSDAARGRIGWTVLGDLHEAYDRMLAEHGPVSAAARIAAGGPLPWMGTTLDDATDSGAPAALDRARVATVSASTQGWVRIVFDPGTDPGDYASAVSAAHRRGLKVLGMPYDSSAAGPPSPAEYEARVRTVVAAFSQQDDPALDIDAWEVGNEVNGEWIDTDRTTGTYTYGSGRMEEKVRAAAAVVRALTDRPVVVTLYWQQATSASPEASTLRWAKEHLVDTGIERSVDVVLLSAYPEDAPLGIGLDGALSALGRLFPGQSIGLGELGYWSADTSRRFWTMAQLPRDPTAAPLARARAAVAGQYYAAVLDHPRSLGGGFWWYFQQDSYGAGGAVLSDAIAAVTRSVAARG